MFKQKKYFCSKNLEQPNKFFNHKDIQNLKDFYSLSTVQPTYKSTFNNEFIGDVEYSQFSLKNCTA